MPSRRIVPRRTPAPIAGRVPAGACASSRPGTATASAVASVAAPEAVRAALLHYKTGGILRAISVTMRPMPSSARRAVWLIGALAALASRPVAAGVLAFSSPGPTAVLEAGTTVPVAWSFAADGPPRFGEMELILSLDGGRSFPIRVTRDLDPRTSALGWRVPALPTEHARLALRSGEGEEPEAEEIRLVSDEFAIASDTGAPLETALFERGEWRLREATENRESGPPAAPETLGDAVPAMAAVHDLPASAVPRRGPPAQAPSRRISSSFEAASLPPAPGMNVPAGAARRDTPKRE